jgi:hypothetical protein
MSQTEKKPWLAVCDRYKDHDGGISGDKEGLSILRDAITKAIETGEVIKLPPTSSHQFRELFENESAHSLRITFRDGDVFRFRSFRMVDPSVYSISDQWNGTVAEQIAGRPPDFRLRYSPGSMIDFVESDIAEIFDESLERSVYVD